MDGHRYGLASGLSEASRAIARGRQPRASTASPSAPKARVFRIQYVGEDPSQESTVLGHAEAWKLAEHELMHRPRVGDSGVVRGRNVTDKSKVTVVTHDITACV